MSTMRLNTKNINKKFLTVVIAIALLVGAGAVALGLSLNAKSSEEAQAKISYIASVSKKEATAGDRARIYIDLSSARTYDVQAAWAYYTMPVTGKQYQIPLEMTGDVWVGTLNIDATSEQGLWIFDGVEVESANGKELFDNNLEENEDANVKVVSTTEDIKRPEYRLYSANFASSGSTLGGNVGVTAAFDGQSPTAGTVYAYIESPSGTNSRQISLMAMGSGAWYGQMTVTDDMESGQWKLTSVQAGLSDGSQWTYNLALEDGSTKTFDISGTAGSGNVATYVAGSAKPDFETIALAEQTIRASVLGSGDAVADHVYAYYTNPGSTLQYQVEMFNDGSQWVGTIPADDLSVHGWWYLDAIQIKSGEKESFVYDTAGALTSGDFFVGSLFEVADIETEIPYDGENHIPTEVVTDKITGVTLTKGTDYKVVYLDGEGNEITDLDKGAIDAGNYTMQVIGIGDQYSGNDIKKEYEITKIAIVFNEVPESKDLTYTGQEQELVTAAETEGAEATYYAVADEAPEKDAEGVWQTEVPKLIDAGDYKVYYWSKGDKNHKDTDVLEAEGDEKIKKYDITAVPEAKQKIYDATTSAEAYISNVRGVEGEILSFDNVLGEYSDKNVSDSTKVIITNQNDIQVTVTGGQGKVENYEITYNVDEAYAKISPRPITIEIPQEAIHYSKTYDGTNKAQIDEFIVDTGFETDQLTVSGLTAEYATKNVGVDIPITIPNLDSATIAGREGTLISNYSLSPLVADNLKGEITQKRAIIAAADKEMEYGESVPELTLENLADFVDGEVPQLGVDYTLQCSATSLSAPGYYVINVVANDTDLMKNYSIVNSRGVLTIKQGDTFTVRFDSNGADEGEMEDQVIKCDVLTPLNANQFKREGYTFLGWSTERKATAPSLTNEAAVKNLTERAGRVTLYAVWHDDTEPLPDEKECYTVVYDSNGGTDGVMVSQLIERDKSTKLAKNIYTKAGYTFLGWSDDKDAETRSIEDAAYVLNLAEKGETITLYAVWSENPDDVDPQEGYTVKFDSNGGEGTMSDQVIEVTRSTVLSKNLFYKTGYRFLGWAMYKEASSAQLADQEVVTQLAESGETIRLYAVWQDASEEPIDPEVDGYTIQFDANGGIGMMADQVIAVDKTTKLSKSIFKRSGYTFWGWSTNADSTVISLTDEQEVLNIADAGTKITLYAVWWDDSAPMPDPANSYVVHYESNGGYGSMSDQTIDADTPTKLATNMYRRAGFTFLGWSAYADANVPSLNNEAEVTHLADKGKSITLYAIWKEGTVEPITEGYTIHYDANGGSGTMSDQLVATNKVTYLAKNIFVRSGYRFLGWSIDKDASVASLTDSQRVAHLANTGETITLYAVWQSESEKPIDETKAYTVCFDANGGNGVMADQKIEVGTTTKLATNTYIPVEGYEFLGWSPDADATDASLLDGAEVTNLAKQGQKIILFAVWKLSTEPPAPTQTFTVKFDANGGSGTMNSQTIAIDTTSKLAANVFTKEGNSFLGWAKDKNATTPDYSDSSTVTNLTTGGKTITLYAVWESIYSKATKTPNVKTGLVYDGTKQDLIAQGESYGGTLVYGVSETEEASGVSEWSEAVPQATNAGTYNIFYYVKADERHVDSEVSELQTVVIGKRKVEVVVDDSSQSQSTYANNEGNVVEGDSSSEKFVAGNNETAKPVVSVSNLVEGDVLTQDVDYNLSDVASTSSARYEITAQSTDAMNNYELTPASDTVVVKSVSAPDSGVSDANKVSNEKSGSTTGIAVTFVSILMIAGAIAFVVARKTKKDKLPR